MSSGEGRGQGKHVHGQGQTQEEKQHNMTGIDGKRGSGILKQKRKKRTQREKQKGQIPSKKRALQKNIIDSLV